MRDALADAAQGFQAAHPATSDHDKRCLGGSGEALDASMRRTVQDFDVHIGDLAVVTRPLPDTAWRPRAAARPHIPLLDSLTHDFASLEALQRVRCMAAS